MPAIGIGIGVGLGGGAAPPPVSDGELDATVSGSIGGVTGTITAMVLPELSATVAGTIGSTTGAFTAQNDGPAPFNFVQAAGDQVEAAGDDVIASF